MALSDTMRFAACSPPVQRTQRPKFKLVAPAVQCTVPHKENFVVRHKPLSVVVVLCLKELLASGQLCEVCESGEFSLLLSCQQSPLCFRFSN